MLGQLELKENENVKESVKWIVSLQIRQRTLSGEMTIELKASETISELRQDPAELKIIGFWQRLLLGSYSLGWKEP